MTKIKSNLKGLREDKKEIMDGVICLAILISVFLVTVFATIQDLPFVYNQF